MDHNDSKGNREELKEVKPLTTTPTAKEVVDALAHEWSKLQAANDLQRRIDHFWDYPDL